MSSPGQVCRICLSNDELQVSIYGAYARKHKILVKIRVCLPISVDPSDNLPRTICHSCVTRLDQYYDYYCNSLTTQRVLDGGEFSFRDYFKKKVDQKLTAAVERRTRQDSPAQERIVPAAPVVPLQKPAKAKRRDDEDLLTQSPQLKHFTNSTYVVAGRSPAPAPSTSFLDLKNSHRKKRNGTSKKMFLTYDPRLPRVSPTLFDDND